MAAAAAAAWFFAPQVRAGWQLRQARKDLALYHCAAAVPRLELCQRVWPHDSEILLLLAQASRRSGDFAAAERWLMECQKLEVRPSDASVLEYSLLKAETGDSEVVEGYLRGIADRGHPQEGLIFEALTKAYLQSHRFTDAMGCLDQWLMREPQNPRAHFLRGKGWQQAASYSRAAGEYQKALDLDPDDDEVRLLLANALIEDGNAADAVPLLNQLRARDPDNPEVLVRLAFAWFAQGQTEASQKVFESLLMARPRFALALLGRGQLELQADRPAAAEQFFRRAVAESPYLRQAHYGLYLALEKQEKKSESAEQLVRLKQLEKTLERITELSNRLIPNARQDPKLKYELGTHFARIGQEDLALQWYYSALRVDAEFQPAHEALANYYEQAGAPEKAEEHKQILKRLRRD